MAKPSEEGHLQAALKQLLLPFVQRWRAERLSIEVFARFPQTELPAFYRETLLDQLREDALAFHAATEFAVAFSPAA